MEFGEIFIVPRGVSGLEMEVVLESEHDATSLARAILPLVDGQVLVDLRAVFHEVFQAFAMYGPDYSARLVPRTTQPKR